MGTIVARAGDRIVIPAGVEATLDLAGDATVERIEEGPTLGLRFLRAGTGTVRFEADCGAAGDLQMLVAWASEPITKERIDEEGKAKTGLPKGKTAVTTGGLVPDKRYTFAAYLRSASGNSAVQTFDFRTA